MKAFRFRLDRVLHLRELHEKDQARRLAEASNQADHAARARDASAERARSAAEQAASAPPELRTAGTLSNLQLPVDAMRRQLEQDEQAEQEALHQVEISRTSFDGARQDRRALQRLKDDQHAEWRKDADRTEQQRMDEIALRVKPRGETE